MVGKLAVTFASVALQVSSVRYPQEEVDVVRLAVARVLDERTIDPSIRTSLVVDSLLRCAATPCNSVLPTRIRTFLRDTAGVQLGAIDSLLKCDVSTFPRRCTLQRGTAGLKLHYPRVSRDTALIGYTWMELSGGNLWGHGAESRFVRRGGRWYFDATTGAWTT
jgi:hypothetical protein